MSLARDVLMFFGCQVEAALHMDSALVRGICRREGVGKVKALEVRTLWLQQLVKARTLTLKTVKSQDKCADLGTKTLAAGTLSLLRGLNGLVDKGAMHEVSRAVRAATICSGESRMLRASALLVLEQGLDEIARNGHGRPQSETEFRGLEPEQLYALCANSLREWSRSSRSQSRRLMWNLWICLHIFRVCSVWNIHSGDRWLVWKSVHAGGVHEICVNS